MRNAVKRLLDRIRAAGWIFCGLLVLAGIVGWGGFNTAMELTNQEQFCISCHEMENNVYQEYRNTIHASNRSGVRATCPDCHVPRDWSHKIVRKIQASNEVLHKVLGSIDTPEKFEAKRLQLAKNEWARMKKTDSAEVYLADEFIDIIHVDDEDGDRSFNFTMAILDVDLDD